MLFPVGDRLVPGAAMLDVLCSDHGWWKSFFFPFFFFFLNPTCIFFFIPIYILIYLSSLAQDIKPKAACAGSYGTWVLNKQSTTVLLPDSASSPCAVCHTSTPGCHQMLICVSLGRNSLYILPHRGIGGVLLKLQIIWGSDSSFYRSRERTWLCPEDLQLYFSSFIAEKEYFFCFFPPSPHL